MKGTWKTVGLIAIPVAYCVALLAFATDALSNGLDDLTVAGVLTLLTAASVGTWYKIGMSVTPIPGRKAQQLASVCGAWAGVVVVLFAAYAFLHMFYGHPWHFSD